MTYPIFGGLQDFKLSKETNKAADPVNAKIAVFNAAQEAHRADVEKFQAIPAASLPDGFQEKAAELIKRRIDLLRDELQIIAQIFPYFRMVEADRKIASDQAYRDHENATAEINEGLLKLGYRQDLINPGMLMRHPRVCELRLLKDSLRQSPYSDLAQTFREREDQIANELEEIRAKTVNV